MRLAFDLHLHSCLSPCGDASMAPADLAGWCRLAGLDVAALTDHHSCGNCPAFCAAGAEYGLLALPGMELCTREEVHVVCLFPALEAALAFQELVYSRLGERRNDPEVFGRQVLMDAEGRALGEEPRFLAGAADIGIYEVHGLVEGLGGAAWPAHIDRDSFSLLSNLGLWDPALGFPLAEVSPRCPPDRFQDRPDLRGVPLLTGSDAHYPHQIQEARQWMDVPAPTPEAVLDWLRRGGRQPFQILGG